MRERKYTLEKTGISFMKILRKDFSSYKVATLTEDSSQ
jgi:hypothetical protein